jgi:DNA repair photolyase
MLSIAELQRAPDAVPDSGPDASTASRPGSPAPAGGPESLPLHIERVRTFATPEFADMRFLEVETKSALNHVRGMPFEWSINPYRGCSHACSYCFARPSHTYLNLSPLEDFEKTIVVKTNVAEVLRRELARPSWTGAHVAMGTNTDPYQRCEGRYRLMPGIIEALAEGLTPFSILTKGTLVTRDLDALRAAACEVSVTCALTVGMLDRALWREAEPGTPSPQARLDAVGKLNAAGIPTGVMLAPIMPELNDQPEGVDALIDAAAAVGATHITPIVLHLRRGVREVFWPWLERHHPELVDRYTELYRRGATAAAGYRKEIEAFVAQRRKAAWARHGRPDGHPSVRGGPRPSRPPQRPETPKAQQLRLL